MNFIRTVFVILFTIINGYILLPYSFRKLDQINNEEIEKEKISKKYYNFNSNNCNNSYI